MHLRCCAFRLGRNDYRLPFPAARSNSAQSAAKRTDFPQRAFRTPACTLSRVKVPGRKSRSFDLTTREKLYQLRESRAFSTAAIIYTAGYKRRLYARYCTVSKSPPFKPALQVSKKNRDLEIFKNDKRKGEFTRFLLGRSWS